MDGIEIPREVADAEGVPEDLDANLGGPYEFPSPRRRRLSGVVYLAGAALAALGAVLGLPAGMYGIAGLLLILGIYHFATAWDLIVGDNRALAEASRRVSFPVGHASAVVVFEGWRSRPIWQVMLYSADEPPSRRGIVRVDAAAGTVIGEPYEEATDGGPLEV